MTGSPSQASSSSPPWSAGSSGRSGPWAGSRRRWGTEVAIWRRAAKRDTSEPGIVEALTAAGARVWRLSLPLDLLVGYQGRFYLLECKTGTRKRKDQPEQDETLAECRYRNLPAYVVRTPEDALQAIGAIH